MDSTTTELLRDFLGRVKGLPKHLHPQTFRDLEDLLRSWRIEPREVPENRAPSQSQDLDQGTRYATVELPRALAERQRQWIGDSLARHADVAQQARWVLGFDDVPFPDDPQLADAMWEWLTTGKVSRARLRRDVSIEARLSIALATLRPRLAAPNPDDPQQARRFSRENAMRGLIDDARYLSEELGCTPRDAALWILAGVVPEHAVVLFNIQERLDGSTTITLVIDPAVVKPDELRSVFRFVRHKIGSGRGQLGRFLSAPLGYGNQTRLAQYQRWNEIYPLMQYRNLSSYRQAAFQVEKELRARQPVGREEIRIRVGQIPAARSRS